MKFGPDNYNHKERCSQGHSSASTIATIEATLAADPDTDSSDIEVRRALRLGIVFAFTCPTLDRSDPPRLCGSIASRPAILSEASTTICMPARSVEPSRPDGPRGERRR
ncbi:BON domain-containing protein [Rhizobium sp. WSM1325]|uniref:BON domain-containing protein n=1 Tax=Rhizobium sp. WSM1325 TaxID=3444086 RepID=UPI003D7C1A9A